MNLSPDAIAPHAGRRIVALVLTIAAGACVPSGHLARDRTSAPAFDPVAFFSGHTQGRGTLHVVLHRAERVDVEGHGVVGADGSIVLDQDVRRGDAAPTHRSWRLHRVAPGRYAGTLTDASGPVAGDVAGNRLHLAFAMRGGFRAQQWLYLQPGGQVSRNRLVVTKLGIPVASLDETITRLP
ncbi:MAG: DUF3833 family protein [Janthinobacterium lividum]